MDSSDNPYEILGISSDTNEAGIKKAYRQEARIHHPDKQKTDEDRDRATAYFAKIADAYGLLQDPVRRYDWRMSQEGKIKSISQKPSSPARSTTSTSTMNRTSLSTRTSTSQKPSSPARSTKSTSTMNRTSLSTRTFTSPTPVRKKASSRSTARTSTFSSPTAVPKNTSVHPNSARASPLSATRSSVRTALPPNNRRSTLRSPSQPQPSQSMQGGRRGKNPSTTGMPMRNSMSVESDLLNFRRPARVRKSISVPMRTMSVDSDTHKPRRPAGGRKKNRGKSVTGSPLSGIKPRNALDAPSEPFTMKKKTCKMSTDRLDAMSCHTPRVKQLPVKQGKLKRTLSLRALTSFGNKLSGGSKSSAGNRSSAGSRLVNQ